MLEREANDGFSCLGVVKVAERRSDGRVLLDADYIPPILHVCANPVADGFLREIVGLLHQRGEALAATLTQPGRAGVGEVADFLLLQLCNRYEPQLAHAQRLPAFHPEHLFSDWLRWPASCRPLATSKRPTELPAYDHDDPALCLRALMNDLRRSLSMVRVQSAVPIELQERKHGVRVAIIPDLELQRTAAFVLAANAQVSSEQLRSRLPGQVKIGPVERFRDLVSLALPGIGVHPLAVAPRQIPFHAGFSYFELDTRGNDLWRQLENSAGLALHLAGDFPGSSCSCGRSALRRRPERRRHAFRSVMSQPDPFFGLRLGAHHRQALGRPWATACGGAAGRRLAGCRGGGPAGNVRGRRFERPASTGLAPAGHGVRACARP